MNVNEGSEGGRFSGDSVGGQVVDLRDLPASRSARVIERARLAAVEDVKVLVVLRPREFDASLSTWSSPASVSFLGVGFTEGVGSSVRRCCCTFC